MKTTWRPLLIEETHKPYFRQLQQFVAEQREKHTVFPPEADVYAALHLTPIEEVRVLILGQDPYHDDHQAHGLCFSVRPGESIPPSLLNIFKELKADLGCQIPNNGCLIPWARQGVLLLNAVLTVEAHQANSHKERGWETFTDAVIAAVNAKTDPVVFVLWGAYARKKIGLIDRSRHVVIESPHPSPLSAYRGFFGSRPFSKINAALTDAGRRPIDWQITDL
ncbi:MAG TPA: uracil-DNA glycosylase [Gallionella sp.]|nr:MAG: uracil-DNA glycosylase [Gallionellales bacterium GWA2_54_124]OGT17760.1 MAG: uracil-DNA glycosylase [Gallionellales bacterium RIFOXYD12_FULL_53_10]HCI52281.1 uracil-DNA glycosylase [Gallionella sp.]